MVRSMTGYGRGRGSVGKNRIEVDLRSVNHRFCEISVKLPKPLFPHEGRIKKYLQERFSRGRLDLQVTLNGGGENRRHLELDFDLARQYRRILTDLKKRLKIKGDADLALFANLRNIITEKESTPDGRPLVQAFFRVLGETITRLDQMRRKEGLALSRDMKKRLGRIRKSALKIMRRAPQVVSNYQDRLRDRVTQLSRDAGWDPRRFEQEAALFASRSDVSEELTRLESHLSQFQSMMEGPEAVGRSLDFLTQEMHREVNTIGSKANDVAISQEVIVIKSEIEKLREQVQNIE